MVTVVPEELPEEESSSASVQNEAKDVDALKAALEEKD